MSYLILILMIGACGVGAYESARLGVADWLYHRDSIESLRQAASVWPNRSEPYQRLAQLAPDEAAGYLQSALDRNPRYAKGWYDLGLQREISGDYAGAEGMLLRSASLDRRFLPAWTLANFYFRRNQPEKFWPWAQRAVEMTFTDLRPLFRLAMQFTRDPAAIASRMVNTPRAQRDFLSFLAEENLIAQAAPVAERLIRNATADDQPAILYYAERQLFAGNTVAAVQAWNALSRAGLIPHAELSAGRPLTNGSFANPLLSRDRAAAFDWRLIQPEGVNVVPTPPSARISFSGKQPEATELLWQFVAMVPGRRYRLTGEYRTAEMRQDTNVRWKLLSAGGRVAGVSPYFSMAEDWILESNVITICSF